MNTSYHVNHMHKLFKYQEIFCHIMCKSFRHLSPYLLSKRIHSNVRYFNSFLVFSCRFGTIIIGKEFVNQLYPDKNVCLIRI